MKSRMLRPATVHSFTQLICIVCLYEKPVIIQTLFFLVSLSKLSFSQLQNLDGACIQSVNLVVDEDPRTEITMSHIGEVFVSSQYRISLPYSDGNYTFSGKPKHCMLWPMLKGSPGRPNVD